MNCIAFDVTASQVPTWDGPLNSTYRIPWWNKCIEERVYWVRVHEGNKVWQQAAEMAAKTEAEVRHLKPHAWIFKLSKPTSSGILLPTKLLLWNLHKYSINRVPNIQNSEPIWETFIWTTTQSIRYLFYYFSVTFVTPHTP